MNRRRRAFTIIELLIVIGLIALLVGLVLVSLKGVRATASRTESLNGLRSVMRAYLTYSNDHRQRLMPGYLDGNALNQLGITAKLPSGTALTACDGSDRCDASSYVWRLAPYMDQAWQPFFIDYRRGALISALEVELNNGLYGPGTVNPATGELGIGLVPSFGLNSIFVGGDTFHGGSDVVDRNPFTPADPSIVQAAVSASQVRNADRLTVFGTAMQANPAMLPIDPPVKNLIYGYVELRAPFLDFDESSGTWTNEQWIVGPGGVIEQGADAISSGAFSDGGGWPVGRSGENDIPVGHFDGSAGVVNRFELATDMSYWSPFATGVR